jgi:hypothetical protein
VTHLDAAAVEANRVMERAAIEAWVTIEDHSAMAKSAF